MNYEKNNSREFEFVKKAELTSKGGKKYSRMFWKLKQSGEIATYIEMSLKYNQDEIEDLFEVVTPTFTGWSFGKKCKQNEEPKYVLSFSDRADKVFSYDELMAHTRKFLPSKAEWLQESIVSAPFKLGENMYSQLTRAVGKKHESTDAQEDGW
ncbi:MAG: hypothetical protein ACTSVR_11775 [Candidatus Thorarchaeota archaeon]